MAATRSASRISSCLPRLPGSSSPGAGSAKAIRFPLQHIRQAGATGVVTALHHIPNGTVWPVEDIRRTKEQIEQAGLRWSVAESIPVHEDIKQAKGDRDRYLANYVQSMRHLAACGVHVVCYNFMPLLDWTRTHLDWLLPDGAEALRFDAVDAAVFDLHILKREKAEADYSARHAGSAAAERRERDVRRRVRCADADDPPGPARHGGRHDAGRIPREAGRVSRDRFRAAAGKPCGLPAARHPRRGGVRRFRCAFIRTIRRFSIFGLPRIASTSDDLDAILAAVDSPANGITFCAGLARRASRQRCPGDLPARRASRSFPAPAECAARGGRQLLTRRTISTAAPTWRR